MQSRNTIFSILVTLGLCIFSSTSSSASSYKLETLPNGLSYVLIQNDRSPNVAQAVLFKSGYIKDPKDSFGISGIAAYLLTYFHKGRKEDELNNIMKSNAINLSVNPTYDDTEFYTVSSREELEDSIRIMSERIVKVDLSEDKLKKTIAALRNIDKKTSSDVQKLYRTMQEKLFSMHPYGKIFYPDKFKMNENTVQAISDYFYSNICPENMVVVVVGDFEYEHASMLIKRYYGGLEGGGHTIQNEVISKPKVESGNVIVKATDAKLPLYSSWFLAPNVLGNKNKDVLSCMIIKQLLESTGKYSISYNMIDSEYAATRYNVSYDPVSLYETSFNIDIELRKNVPLDRVENKLGQILAQLTSGKITSEELMAAKKVLITKAKMANEDNLVMAQSVADSVSITYNPNYMDDLLAQLNQVTLIDVNNMATKLFNDKNKVSGYLQP